ncbi:MAG: FAD-dependent oxidoreductase [Thermoplasmataceae archaeon]
METERHQCIIVGGASAGLTAALYLARQALDIVVITKDIGGQALLTDDIENYPGFMQISGFDLMTKFQKQAEAYGAKFVYDEVQSIEKTESGFVVKTREQNYEAMALVLAFGKTPKNLDVPGEEENQGRGVSYCAVCDGPLYKGKTVAVVGVGDHVLQAASYLSTVVSKLYVIYRGSKIQEDDELYQELKSNDRVEIMINAKVTKILGDKGVKGVQVQTADGKTSDIAVSALFVEMGYVAKTEMVKDLVKLNEAKEIITDKLARTSTDGVFACGDVTDIPYKQAVISAGEGATAALSAFNYVQRKLGKHGSRTDWKSIAPKKSTGSSEFMLRVG